MYEQLPVSSPGDMIPQKDAGVSTRARLAAITQWLAQNLPPTAEAQDQTGITFADEAAEKAWLGMQQRSKRLAMTSANGLVTNENMLLPLAAAEIAHFTSGPGYVTLTTLGGQTHPVALTLDELETAVDAQLFFRANPSALVARAGIVHTEPLPDGTLRVQLKAAAPEEVVIPQTRTATFLAWISAV